MSQDFVQEQGLWCMFEWFSVHVPKLEPMQAYAKVFSDYACMAPFSFVHVGYGTLETVCMTELSSRLGRLR